MTDIVSHLGNMVDIFMSSIQFLSKESSIILIIRSQKQNQTHFVHWTEFSHGAYIIMANSISPTFCYSLNWKSIANAILWHSITFFAIFFFLFVVGLVSFQMLQNFTSTTFIYFVAYYFSLSNSLYICIAMHIWILSTYCVQLFAYKFSYHFQLNGTQFESNLTSSLNQMLKLAVDNANGTKN